MSNNPFQNEVIKLKEEFRKEYEAVSQAKSYSQFREDIRNEKMKADVSYLLKRYAGEAEDRINNYETEIRARIHKINSIKYPAFVKNGNPADIIAGETFLNKGRAINEILQTLHDAFKLDRIDYFSSIADGIQRTESPSLSHAEMKASVMKLYQKTFANTDLAKLQDEEKNLGNALQAAKAFLREIKIYQSGANPNPKSWQEWNETQKLIEKEPL
jgi:hypothetical protein